MLEHYRYACMFRTARTALLDLLTVHPQRVNSSQLHRISRILNSLDLVRSQMEELMFHEHRMLPDEWLQIYYGTEDEAEAVIMCAFFGRDEDAERDGGNPGNDEKAGTGPKSTICFGSMAE